MFKDFVVNDRPMDKQSTIAARASYCAADQGKYWQYHDEVYDNSKGEDVGWVTKEVLNQFAQNIKVPDLMALLIIITLALIMGLLDSRRNNGM